MIIYQMHTYLAVVGITLLSETPLLLPHLLARYYLTATKTTPVPAVGDPVKPSTPAACVKAEKERRTQKHATRSLPWRGRQNVA